MDGLYYTSERGTQCLVALLKAHNIRKIIISPGATNLALVGSLQNDSWFELYSSVDERSAAYIACGMAAESGEPVVITCTGATASRNYIPGLTEAYYRKLPILAVTYNTGIDNRHHLIPQQIDRSVVQKDICRLAVDIPIVKDKRDEHFVNVEINKAILALTQQGGGPVHINISTAYTTDYSVTKLPEQRVIRRISSLSNPPSMDSFRHIAIFVGSHQKFSDEETKAIDRFCESRNAVVFCDHTSGYYGKYKVVSALFGAQPDCEIMKRTDLLIHLGEISGDYYKQFSPKEVWRVNIDGEIKDTFHRLHYIFQIGEKEFFEEYSNCSNSVNQTLEECIDVYNRVKSRIPELPFSNIWIAQHTSSLIPFGSVVHLGILNSLRSWNFFQFKEGVESFSNVGGFGIDGILSTLIGASLASPQRICYAVIGDLAFFYDLNALGNRHIANNIRILLINNGKGTEFTNYGHVAHQFGDKANLFMAAAGHFGNKSHNLIKHFAQDLGFEYLTASSKEEYLAAVERFTVSEQTSKPMIFEVFTDSKDESDALEIMLNLTHAEPSVTDKAKSAVKDAARKILGEKGIKIAKIIRE